MRILQIRFKNLNSLVGEWQIDLSHPAYTSDGIFAITGPTGAGKSTILDAICLALYGKTPRLDRVNNSENEIMSRQTGECFAEVTFRASGRNYRCFWSQHRARRRADGSLQPQKHEISDAKTGALLHTQIRGVALEVESITGMDFLRFTKTMLLAQGDFAAFLQAEPNDRSPILEQITGTEIYSKISKKIHERKRDEDNRWNLLNVEVASISVLDSETEQGYQDDLTKSRNEERALSNNHRDANNALNWHKVISALEREIAALQTEEKQLKDETDVFAPQKQKLEIANKLASLDADYASLSAQRRQQAEDKKALQIAEAALPDLISTTTTLKEKLDTAEQDTKNANANMEKARPLFTEIRALDHVISTQEKAYNTAQKALEKDQTEIKKDIETKRKTQTLCDKKVKDLEAVNDYLAENAEDAWLVENLAGIRVQFTNLISQNKDIVQTNNDLKNAEKALKKKSTALTEILKNSGILAESLESLRQKIKEKGDALGALLGERLLREYRAEKDNLQIELIYLRQIANLEEERKRLIDGKPCPLCGAGEHPYAQGNIPAPNATEQRIADISKIISDAEDFEDKIAALKDTQAAEQQRFNASDAQKIAAERDKETAQNELERKKTELSKLADAFERAKEAITTLLKPLGIAEIPDTKIDTLLDSLGERLQAWRRHQNQKADIERIIADYNTEIKRIEGIIETKTEALKEDKKNLISQAAELETRKTERFTLFGAKKPDAEEAALNDAIRKATDAEAEARKADTDHQSTLAIARDRIDSLQQDIGQRVPALQQLEAGFLVALKVLEIANEEDYKKALIPPAQREVLNNKSMELDQRQRSLLDRLSDRNERLKSEIEKNLTSLSIGEVKAQIEELNTSLGNVAKKIGSLKATLDSNEAAKERLSDRQAAIEAQTRECTKWNNLHQLIGSADGRKYRNFAQGLTFDLVISHANIQLQRLTDRYLLCRKADEILELEVIDNYQAGVSRTTKNLSGGESFLVSLSLALGLSQMVSQKTSLDSLFLDEGFGTLDEDSLSVALEALASYQQEGKIIGVISHVQALKERIGTQIQVNRQSAGNSTLTGPGCSRVQGDAGN
ncbi:MAG: AAA family ATPase [Candidatus Cloacimonetes bacterium]|nr:AAA family ATPase [Candidatus Cloacimonadota bacterium]